MATITTDTFLDSGTARTAGEAWTINGSTLTIRTDTRWHVGAPASMTGTLSAITTNIASGGGLFLDASNIRWMAFDTGSGIVPAIGATITQGGVSGYLLGMWPALNQPPAAPGAAMPATGFLKFREVTGGQFAVGALTGISANALATPGSGSGADAPGWLEFVQDTTSSTNSFARLGLGIKTRGNWFYLGETTGSAGQQIITPSNGGGAGCNGVQIETAPGSGIYEWFPTMTAATYFTTTNLTTDIRAKFVESVGNAIIRIGSNGTSNIGYVPPAGCKIRMPNILQRQASSAARATNVTPTTGGQFSSSSGTSWDIEFMEFQTNLNGFGTRAAYFRVVNSSTTGPVGAPVTMAGPNCQIYIDNCLFGGLVNSTTGNTHTFTNIKLGGTISNSIFVQPNPTTRVFLLSSANDLTLTNNTVTSPFVRASATIYGLSLLQCSNITAINTKTQSFGTYISASINCSFTNTDYIDRLAGASNTSAGASVFSIINSSYITIDGVSFGFNGALADTNCRSSIFAIGDNCSNIKCRNMGSASARVSVSATAPPLYIFSIAGVCYNLAFQRLHISKVTSYVYSNMASCYSGLLVESCTAPTWNNPGVGNIGASFPNNLRGYTKYGPDTYSSNGVVGLLFTDYFTSETAGCLMFQLNAPDTVSTNYITVSSTYKQGTGFQGDGALSLDTVGDYFIVEMPYFVKGHTALANSAPNIKGVLTSNFTYTYQIDTGTGWNGTWKAFTAANLSAESVSPSGFKIKVKGTVNTANLQNAVNNINIITATTVAAQAANLYPLDTVALGFTNLVAGSEVRVYAGSDPATATEIGGTESTGTTYSFTHSSGGTAGVIVIFAMGYQPFYLPYTFKSVDDSILVQQVIDRNYVNPA